MDGQVYRAHDRNGTGEACRSRFDTTSKFENRTWSTKERGDLFLHARVGYGEEQWLQEEFGLCVPDLRGVFTAMYRLVDVDRERRWAVRR
jgi:hypothetical protein